MMKYFYLCFVCICFACAPKTVKNSTDLIPIEVSVSEKENSFENFYDSVQIIKLDKTILLSGISNIQRSKDAFYVLDNRRTIVAKYDLTGKYISHINGVGRGRDEYISIFSMRVDTLSKTLILTDSFTKKILLFDLDLNHLKTIMTDINVGEIAAFRDGKFLHGQVSEIDRTDDQNSKANGSVVIIDSLGKIVDGFNPFPLDIKTPVPQRSISSDGENFVLFPVLSKYIYSINSTFDEVVPMYSLDFKVKDWSLLDYQSYLSASKNNGSGVVINMLGKLEGRQSTTFAWGYIINSDTSLLLRFGNFNPLICLYNKNTGISKSYFTNTLAESNALALILAFPFSSYGENFYTAMDVGTLKSISRFENLPDQWKEQIDKLDDEENPIIFTYKIN